MRMFCCGFIIAFFNLQGKAQTSLTSPTYEFAVMQYGGGGDWYSNPTSMPNLVKFCNEELGINVSEDVPYVSVGAAELSLYPFIHMTGHGNVIFSQSEAENLRNYLLGGGFLHIDDNYGMDESFRREMELVFPEYNLVEIPKEHPVFHMMYEFPSGLPKVHEHDGNAPQAYGIFHEGRLLVFYSFESDLGDGWENAEVHDDAPEIRESAIQMGVNLYLYVLGQLIS